MTRGMLRGIAVFRWGTWAWMAFAAFEHRDAFRHPLLAIALIGAAFAWTVAATVLLFRRPAALETIPAIAIELCIGAALGLGGGLAYSFTTDPNVAFQSVRNLGFAWPMAGILSAGVVYGP